MNIIENAFPGAAGGKFRCFLVFLFEIPYVLAYMTFLEILKILQNDRAYMTSYIRMFFLVSLLPEFFRNR